MNQTPKCQPGIQTLTHVKGKTEQTPPETTCPGPRLDKCFVSLLVSGGSCRKMATLTARNTNAWGLLHHMSSTAQEEGALC